MKQLYRPLATLVIIVILAVLLAFVHHKPSPPPSKPHVSAPQIQAALWRDYKQHYWQNGRAFDPQNNGDTTSEAQSYTLLRAVWENDRPTFDATWAWTSQNLQRSDKLFSWKWGKQPDGSSGVLTSQGGDNTASDADTDIALALLLAGNKWRSTDYTQAAAAIISAIWEQEVVTIRSQPYLTADQLEKNSPNPLLNPSYFAPYAYRLFAPLDLAHPWSQLAANSYTALQTASQQQLGSDTSAGLPPDWVQISKQSGQITAATGQGHDTDFGYDALRAVWRTALDYQWNGTAAAKSTLASFSALADDWDHSHQLYAVYHHDGKPAVQYPSYAMYGASLGYFSIIHPATATAIYKAKFVPLYDSAHRQLTKTLNYYDNNWAWFGLALYGHQLPKLAPGGAI